MLPEKEHFHTLFKGVLHTLFAWLCLSFAVLLVKLAVPHSSLFMVLFFQSFFSLLLIIPWVIKGDIHDLKTSEWRMILVRTFFGVLGFGFMFHAVQTISVVSGILLNNAAPIYIPVIGWLWLRKKIDHRLWLGIFIGFIGVILILQPGKEFFSAAVHSNEGVTLSFILAVISGICLGITMIAMRLLLKTEKVFTVLFYFYLFGSLMTLPFAIGTWVQPSMEVWGYLIGIGLLSFIGQYSLLKSFHYGKPAHLGPFTYVVVIYGGLIDWFFFGTIPTYYFLLGVLLIVLGGIWTIVFSKPIAEQK